MRNQLFKIILIASGFALLGKYLSYHMKESDKFTVVGMGKFSHASLHVQVDGCESRRVSQSRTSSIVFMEDGSSFVVDGLRDFPFSKGTMVQIEENAFGQRRITKVDSVPNAVISTPNLV